MVRGTHLILCLHRITCLACHPVEQSIAVGNDQGRIALFNAVTSDKPVQATYHWHAHAVSSVIFNSDGTYMLSGGLEAVLVIWQLESGVKRFLPRLGTLTKLGSHAILAVFIDS